MTSSEVDYYDVQRMVEDEASRLRGRIENEAAERRAGMDELREQVAELRQDVADALVNKGTLA